MRSVIERLVGGMLAPSYVPTNLTSLSACTSLSLISRTTSSKVVLRSINREMSLTIEGNLGRSSSNRKKMAIVGPGQGKHAVTHYTTLKPLDGAALVECRLETGRTHQVRVHMASIGHALLGDQVYGGRGVRDHRILLEELGFRRQALHAALLGFTHPVTSQALSFESNMPADMQELFSHLLV